MKKLLGAFTILLLLTGCFKRDEVNVNEPCKTGCAVFNISVTTGNNAIPISNAYVDLVWVDTKTELGGTSRLIAKGYTNSNGKISFSFKAKTNEFIRGSFSITSKSTPDYFVTYKTYYDIRKPDTVLNADVHLPSTAHLRLVYRNFDPQSADDLFDAEPYFNNFGSNPIALQVSTPNTADYPNSYFFFNQKPFDSLVFTGTTAGNQYTYFQTLIKRNGTRTDHLDSIFIEKGVTKTYELDYHR